jgi:formylglycine-generating enzyme required for sulfatase activity
VAQFRAYVESSSNTPRDPDALRDPDSRPVIWVSWHEALAYCAWLTEQFRTSPLFANLGVALRVREQGWQFALPSELEWEKAARGGLPEAVFPWGDPFDANAANCSKADVGETSVVGCFAANGYGLYDMVGNVWEWTRSLWGTDSNNPSFVYPYRENDSSREDLSAGNDVYRVVRGGSRNDPRSLARCACRGGNRPNGRSGLLGFRVVLRLSDVLLNPSADSIIGGMATL